MLQDQFRMGVGTELIRFRSMAGSAGVGAHKISRIYRSLLRRYHRLLFGGDVALSRSYPCQSA